MQAFKSAEDIRHQISALRASGRTIALVPTMGALHDGHLSLIEIAKQNADIVVVSIFVNPNQFNSPDDLKNYPRTMESDLSRCAEAGVDLVFTPEAGEIYHGRIEITSATPTGLTSVRAGQMAIGLCGAARPGHFDGVVTIVAILFHITAPDIAVFGEKDFQQLKVIEALVRDLHIAVKILPAPLIREPDGLALSSRNVRLSAEERYSALYLPRTLFKVREFVFNSGLAEVKPIIDLVRENLEKAPSLKIDYIDVVDTETLQPLKTISRRARLLAAVFSGPVRLIDNIQLELPADRSDD